MWFSWRLGQPRIRKPHTHLRAQRIPKTRGGIEPGTPLAILKGREGRWGGGVYWYINYLGGLFIDLSIIWGRGWLLIYQSFEPSNQTLASQDKTQSSPSEATFRDDIAISMVYYIDLSDGNASEIPKPGKTNNDFRASLQKPCKKQKKNCFKKWFQHWSKAQTKAA